jgi:glutaredoxin
MAHLSVTLYTKPDCPLCDEAKRLLESLRDEVAFVVEERNILDDPDDFARFHSLIPVIDISGGVVLYPPHDWLTLRETLHAARRSLRVVPHDLPTT